MARRRSTRGKNGPARALIADDDRDLREGLRTLFKRKGFVVHCTGSLKGSIGWLRKRAFDVVVLDMRMPEDSGPEVEEDAGLVIARVVYSVPLTRSGFVVVFTAFPSVKDCFAVTRAGAYYLPKTLPRRNMSRELVNECARLVTERREREEDGRPTWLGRHYARLREQFAGKTVAIVDRHVAEECGLKSGAFIGDRFILVGKSAADLRNTILGDARLRRVLPPIVDVLEESELE